MAVLFYDITERKQAEEALRRSEARQSFLLELADTLRPLSDAVTIQEVVTRTALNYFDSDRAYYCEIDGDDVTIRRDASRQELPSVAGTYSLSAMPLFKGVSEAGSPIVVDDVPTSEVTDDVLKQLCIEMKILSYINVPVLKKGQLVGSFCLTQTRPRDWTDDEIELAEEIAQRTWEAVERGRAELALHELTETLEEQVEERTEQVRALASDLTLAEHEERGRIAQVLHDDLQQQLYALQIRFKLLRAETGSRAEAEIEEMEEKLQTAITTARQLSVDLSPPILEGEGLTEAVGWLANLMAERHWLRVQVEAEDSFVVADVDRRVLLFQAVRELLFNVVKHAGVAEATVRLQLVDQPGEEKLYRIDVIDKGTGFDPEAVLGPEAKPNGRGLLHIRQRLNLIGGTVKATANPDEGTCVTIAAPPSGKSSVSKEPAATESVSEEED